MVAFTETYIDRVAQAIAEKVDDPNPTMDDRRLYRIYALLALTLGYDVLTSHVHDAWSVWQIETMPEHWSIIPFDELKPEVKAYDREYMQAILDVVQEMGL